MKCCQVIMGKLKYDKRKRAEIDYHLIESSIESLSFTGQHQLKNVSQVRRPASGNVSRKE